MVISLHYNYPVQISSFWEQLDQNPLVRKERISDQLEPYIHSWQSHGTSTGDHPCTTVQPSISLLWFCCHLDNRSIMTLAVCICCIVMVLFMLVDLQSQCMGQVSKQVNIVSWKVAFKVLKLNGKRGGRSWIRCMYVIHQSQFIWTFAKKPTRWTI